MILYLFDIDGTLLHAGGSGRAAFDAVMRAHHGVADACAGLSFGGKTDPALVDEVYLARLDRRPTDAERAAFLADYLPELRARLATGGVEVIDGVREALAFLATTGPIAIGIATGNVRAGADAKLAAARLDGFSVGGYGCDSHVRAELVAAAIRRAGPVARSGSAGPRDGELIDEVIVIGDTVHDIAAARANGATACAVTTGSDSHERLAHADVVFASLRELPAWAVTGSAAARTARSAP